MFLSNQFAHGDRTLLPALIKTYVSTYSSNFQRLIQGKNPSICTCDDCFESHKWLQNIVYSMQKGQSSLQLVVKRHGQIDTALYKSSITIIIIIIVIIIIRKQLKLVNKHLQKYSLPRSGRCREILFMVI